MAGDSCSKGREFESWHYILDGHFSHTYILSNVFVKTKINERGWPIK